MVFNIDLSPLDAHVDRDYIFDEDQDIIKYVTTEMDNWMSICQKIMDNKIDPHNINSATTKPKPNKLNSCIAFT